MEPVEVIVVADKRDRFCRSCQSGRTMDEITVSLAKQLHRKFGDAVLCRFVDIHDVEGANVPALTEEIRAGQARLPLIAIDGHIRYRGLFSPTFIQRDIERIVSLKRVDSDENQSRHPTVSAEQIKRLRMRQFILRMRPEASYNRLSHIPSSGKR